MANIILYPPFGTLEQSSSVKFELIDINVDDIKVEIENVTDGVHAEIKHFEKTEKRIEKIAKGVIRSSTLEELWIWDKDVLTDHYEKMMPGKFEEAWLEVYDKLEED